MSDIGDRRARKKAATRTLVLETAQRLFDERGFDVVTIADIAAQADVAVQTVFNHFASKEDLFFTGRAPWVDAPAAAVRQLGNDRALVTEVRASLVKAVEEHIAGLADPAHRRFLATMAASPALQARERELNEQARQQLETALTEAWSKPGRDPGTVRVAAALVSATSMAAVRAVAVAARDPMPTPDEANIRAQQVARFTDTVLSALESALRASVSPTAEEA